MNIRADVATFDILGHLIIWFLLTLITFGIAAFFFPYSFSKFILNRAYIVDERDVERRMECHTEMFGNIGHIILWAIISIITLGLGYAFYFYKVWNYSLNNTTVH